MSQTPLQTYLNDHLAGSVAALELLDHLAGTAATPETQQFFMTLHGEIAAERHTLQELLQQLGGTESGLRKAGAWLAEKLGEAKLRVDDAMGGRVKSFEALETLALGIQGKLALWVALEAVRDRITELQAIDLPRLQRQSRDQHARVEARRVAAAREVLS